MEEQVVQLASNVSGNLTINERKFSGLEQFQFYFTPLLVYLGTAGNGLSVYVFFSTKLNKLSSSYYLGALTISDNIFLASLFVVWLRMIEVDLFNKPGVCHLIVYLTGVSSFLSVWLVLAFTVERFVAVKYPLLRQSVCTVTRAKITIVVLVVFAMAIYIPSPMFAAVSNNKGINVCTVDPEWQEVINVFNYIDTTITFVVPVVVIIFLNVCIGRTVWKLSGVRKRLTYREGTGQTKEQVQFKKSAALVKRRQRATPIAQNKITKMLLVVSTVCLCLNLPSYVMRVLADLIQIGVLDDVDLSLFVTTQHYCQQLYYTNFGINFILYCISGQNFRKALKSMRCRKKQIRKHEFTALTESRNQSSVSSSMGIVKKRRLPNIIPEDRENRSKLTKVTELE